MIVTAAVALVAAPVADAAPLICLDPGHARTPNLTTEPIGPGSSIRKIKDGGGAQRRSPVVLAIGLKRSLLLDRGYRVAMTRNGPTFTRGAGGNVDRAKFCNRQRAALDDPHPRRRVVQPADARRLDALPGVAAGWTDDIYRPSLRAAGPSTATSRTTGAANRGLVARSDLTGFNWANVPVILVETGSCRTPPNGGSSSRAYQWRVARGLAAGTAAFVPPS